MYPNLHSAAVSCARLWRRPNVCQKGIAFCRGRPHSNHHRRAGSSAIQEMQVRSVSWLARPGSWRCGGWNRADLLVRDLQTAKDSAPGSLTSVASLEAMPFNHDQNRKNAVASTQESLPARTRQILHSACAAEDAQVRSSQQREVSRVPNEACELLFRSESPPEQPAGGPLEPTAAPYVSSSRNRH